MATLPMEAHSAQQRASNAHDGNETFYNHMRAVYYKRAVVEDAPLPRGFEFVRVRNRVSAVVRHIESDALATI